MPQFFFCLILFVVCTLPVYSQDYEKKIDSLNARIPYSTDGELTQEFNKISEYSLLIPKTIAFEKINISLEAARKSEEAYAEFLALRNLSRLHAHYLQQTEALRYMQEGLHYARQQTDTFTLALSYFHTAEFYKQQQLLPTALENLLKASSLFEALGDHRYVASCRNLAANVHYSARNFIQAVEEAELVISHYKLIPEVDRTSEDEFQAMSTYNTLGLCYYKTKDYEKSLIHYALAEEYAKKQNREFWIGLINGNRAIVFQELNLYDKALRSLLQDYHISIKYKEYESAVRAASTIAELYVLQGETTIAQNYLDSAGLLIDDLNRFELSTYWKILASVKKTQGDFAGAYDALERYSTLRDSMNQRSESLNLTKVKANFELESKQREIEELAIRDQQNRDQIKWQNTILFASAAIVMLLLVLILVYIFNVRKLKLVNKLIKRQHEEIEYKNEELEAQSLQLQSANDLANALNMQLEEKVADRTQQLELTLNELDTFLYRSSHDIRRPLTTLLGLENVAKLRTQDKEVLQIFEMVGDTVRHMDSMLLKLQMAYELVQQSIEFERVPLAEIINDQVEKFRKRIVNGRIDVTIHSAKPIPLFSNAKLITIIIKNLLENAVNFRKPENHQELIISIQIFYEENQLQLIVSDNGIGIEDPYLPKIFDQYFKGTQSSKGNGLGLYLVQKALEKLKGNIQVSSEIEKGSTFTVALPYTPN
jgi:signal transduction histidine kinase